MIMDVDAFIFGGLFGQFLFLFVRVVLFLLVFDLRSEARDLWDLWNLWDLWDLWEHHWGRLRHLRSVVLGLGLGRCHYLSRKKVHVPFVFYQINSCCFLTATSAAATTAAATTTVCWWCYKLHSSGRGISTAAATTSSSTSSRIFGGIYSRILCLISRLLSQSFH